MSFTIPIWDSIELDFRASEYQPESWDSISIDFEENMRIDVLPWSQPTLTRHWSLAAQQANQKNYSLQTVAGKSDQADRATAGRFEIGNYRSKNTSIEFDQPKKTDDETRLSWRIAISEQQEIIATYKQGITVDETLTSSWNQGTLKQRNNLFFPFVIKTGFVDCFQTNKWWHVDMSSNLYDDDLELFRLRNTDPNKSQITLVAFGQPYTPPPWNDIALNFGWAKPSRPAIPHDTETNLTARQATPRDNPYVLPWGAGDTRWRNWNLPYPVEENEPDPTDPTSFPEIKTVYLIMNTLEITDVETSTPLDITNIQISLDIDSLAWKFSGQLFGDGSLSLVQPDANGMKDIRVRINSHEWIFAIERYQSDERFPTKKYQVNGISRTQYMAAPFAPTSTGSNAIATTAIQAAQNVLLNTGFSLDWPSNGDDALSDWPLPIGSLNYRDLTTAQIVGKIVKAAGGVLIPKKDSDEWLVQPRYKTAPWLWGTAVPDVQVYAGMIRSRSGSYEPGQTFDSCFVSGIEQGVSVEVQRQGSGGLNPMPDIYDDLITDTQPAISRGRSELAASGNKVIETLSVFIPESGAAPGIIMPGQLLKVLHDNSAADYLGLVLSTNIGATKAGGAAIYQNVTIERNA